MSKNTSKSKKSSAEIRNIMIDRGALFLKFHNIDYNYEDRDTHVKWFEHLLEHGLLVTTGGCIFAYENFYSGSKGRPKAPKQSALFFKGQMPTFSEHRHKWPVECQVSHLCHRTKCINPEHMVYEPQWCNLKRNYCGENGTCDCGRTPPCINVYHNSDWEHHDRFVSYDTPNLQASLETFLPNVEFDLLDKYHYHKADVKKIQRNERLQSKRKASTQEELVDSEKKKTRHF